MTLIKDYFDKTEEWIKEYGERTVVFMQVGAFYEVYGYLDKDNNFSGSKISEISIICDLSIANKIGDDKDGKSIKMAGFRDYQIDKYLKKLNEQGWTCVVYKQDVDTKNTTRSLLGIYTPGTFFTDDTNQVSNNIICIWVHKVNRNTKLHIQEKLIIGLSIIDIFTGKVYITEIITDSKYNPSSFDELERIISIYKPNEVLMIGPNIDNNILYDISIYSGISRNILKLFDNNNNTKISKNIINSEKQNYQKETLDKFYMDNVIDNIFYELQEEQYSLQALTFLLNYIYSHNPNLTSKLHIPEKCNNNSKLVLANHSLKQLNMINDGNTISNNKYSSIISLLNVCQTAMGKRSFKYTLLNPIANKEKLENLYNITEEWISNKKWNSIRPILKDIKDIEKMSRKLLLKRFVPKDFCILYDSIEKINIINNSINQTENSNELNEYLYGMNCDFNNIKLCIEDLKYFIENCIDLEEAYNIDTNNFNSYSAECNSKGKSFIVNGYNEELDDACSGGLIWKNKAESIRQWLQSLVLITETKSKSKNNIVKLHETPTMAPTFTITKRRGQTLKLEIEKLLKKLKKSKNTIVELNYLNENNKEIAFSVDLNDIIIEPSNSKSEDIITSNYIKKVMTRMLHSKTDLCNILNDKFKEICNKFLNKISLIVKLCDFIEKVDVLHTRCYIAETYNYCKPIIKKNEQSYVKALGMRHPLIEHIQTRELYVSNDLELGKNEVNGILLFGTNAVGKTSLIKSLGINVIMAQSGLFVPCSYFEYNPYQYIFTRILGNDNIHRGLSTFAVEMIELRSILKYANKNSLILGDELCSGTESESALSIFTAGLEELHNIGSSFIFATHFHEVTDYEEIKQMDKLVMKHMSVTYDKENDILLYDRKLKDGSGERMYGLEVCKSLDLPSKFLERAHEIRIKYNKENTPILEQKTSRYNSKKIKGKCEICSNIGVDVHHLDYQKNCDEKGFLKNGQHKNHLGNLINICEECHDNIHKNNIQYKKIKTTQGYKILEI